MVEIKLGVYEKNDLIRVLDYAKIKKVEDAAAGIISEGILARDLQTINVLQMRVLGKDYKQFYEVQKNA
jgi:hypothetical protein